MQKSRKDRLASIVQISLNEFLGKTVGLPIWPPSRLSVFALCVDSENHEADSINDIINSYSRILERAAHEDRQINIHQLSESFSMETIGSCVFGVRAGCFECIDSEFIGELSWLAKSIFEQISLDAYPALPTLFIAKRKSQDCMRNYQGVIAAYFHPQKTPKPSSGGGSSAA